MPGFLKWLLTPSSPEIDRSKIDDAEEQLNTLRFTLQTPEHLPLPDYGAIARKACDHFKSNFKSMAADSDFFRFDLLTVSQLRKFEHELSIATENSATERQYVYGYEEIRKWWRKAFLPIMTLHAVKMALIFKSKASDDMKAEARRLLDRYNTVMQGLLAVKTHGISKDELLALDW